MSESRLSWHRSFLARSSMAWSFNNCKSQVKQTVTSRKIIRHFLTHCNDPFEPFKKIWFLFFWMLLGSLQINQKISKPFCYGQTNLDEVPNSLYKKHTCLETFAMLCELKALDCFHEEFFLNSINLWQRYHDFYLKYWQFKNRGESWELPRKGWWWCRRQP